MGVRAHSNDNLTPDVRLPSKLNIADFRERLGNLDTQINNFSNDSLNNDILSKMDSSLLLPTSVSNPRQDSLIKNTSHAVNSQNNNNRMINDGEKPDTSPTIPFTITRTASSTSMSSSARVQVKTPLSHFSLRQGPDRDIPPLPAPHLRPSLLKHAAHLMAKKTQKRRQARSIYDIHTSMQTLSTNTYKERNKPRDLYFRYRLFVPSYRFSLKRDHRPTERRLFRDHLTVQMDAPSICKGMNNAIFYSHPEYGCKQYNLCIPQYSLR